MTPLVKELYEQGGAIKVKSPVGWRLVTGVIPVKEGYAFADTGWSQNPPYHPFHVVPKNAVFAPLDPNDFALWDEFFYTRDVGETREKSEDALREYEKFLA